MSLHVSRRHAIVSVAALDCHLGEDNVREMCDTALSPGLTTPYLRGMPRSPKDFAVRDVLIQPDVSRTTRITPTAEVPLAFTAQIEFGEPPLTVTLKIEVSVGGQAQAKKIEISHKDGAPVTTSAMRKVLVDQLVSAALAKASVEVKPLPDVHPYAWESHAFDNVFGPEGVVRIDEGPASVRQERSDSRAQQAAAIYRAAVAAGSRAPADAVATEMGYSRSQAARYLRRARELGFLSVAEEPLEDVAETLLGAEIPPGIVAKARRLGRAAVSESGADPDSAAANAAYATAFRSGLARWVRQGAVRLIPVTDSSERLEDLRKLVAGLKAKRASTPDETRRAEFDEIIRDWEEEERELAAELESGTAAIEEPQDHRDEKER